jgi:hypothetical protein
MPFVLVCQNVLAQTEFSSYLAQAVFSRFFGAQTIFSSFLAQTVFIIFWHRLFSSFLAQTVFIIFIQSVPKHFDKLAQKALWKDLFILH